MRKSIFQHISTPIGSIPSGDYKKKVMYEMHKRDGISKYALPPGFQKKIFQNSGTPKSKTTPGESYKKDKPFNLAQHKTNKSLIGLAKEKSKNLD